MFLITWFFIVLGDLVLLVHGFNFKNKDDGFVPVHVLRSIAPPGHDPLQLVDSGVGVDIQDIQVENAINLSLIDSSLQDNQSSSYSQLNAQSWTCVRCTFINEFTRNECDICKLQREKSIQPESLSQDEALLFGSKV